MMPVKSAGTVRAVALALVLAAAGCGSGDETFKLSDVRPAFAAEGLDLVFFWPTDARRQREYVIREIGALIPKGTSRSDPPFVVVVYSDAMEANEVLAWERIAQGAFLGSELIPVHDPDPEIRRANVIVFLWGDVKAPRNRIDAALARLDGE